MANPKVFMDISMSKGGLYVGRIVIELYADTTPRMAKNFRILCNGKDGKPPYYRGSTLVLDKSSGTCVNGTGIGYPPELDLRAENFVRKHTGPGTVSMLPERRYFYIPTIKAPRHWEGRYVVVGQVVQGLDVVKALLNDDSGYIPVITNCGQLPEWNMRATADMARMMSNLNNQLSDGLKKINVAKQQVLRMDKEQVSGEQLVDLEEIVSCAGDTRQVLTDLKSETEWLEKHNNELLDRMDKQISNIKNKKVALDAIASLPDAELDVVASAVKKVKSDRRRH